MQIFEESIEQKFVFPMGQLASVRDWMEYRFCRDPRHYSGTVHSIYFDTPSLHLFEEKRNSDYQKAKVRLRWYDSRPDSATVNCFLEVKRKFGAVRRKRRQSFELPREALRGDPFSHPAVGDLASNAFAHGYFPPGPLVPAVEIRYSRLRYVDPESGSRLSLDYDIRCERANLPLFRIRPPVYLDNGVLEQKGTTRFLLPSQEPIAALLQKSAFSKYAECLEALLQPLIKRR